ncbi:MAG TPA: response regulator [Blastocatellia bacterium]|nr:response regulator [Blastocatellia bacterium]
MNILIAEDDPVSRRILEKVLQNWGHTTASCVNGKAGWELFEKGDYGLIISDWMMPEMDGLEFCRRVREANRPEYCYFILLTAKSGRESYMEGMDAGADDYLTKPLNSEELKVRLRVAERILSLHLQIKTLRGILPICAWCKKVRDDDTLWHNVEDYIASHTKTDLSHSICPDCMAKHFGEAPRP